MLLAITQSVVMFHILAILTSLVSVAFGIDFNPDSLEARGNDKVAVPQNLHILPLGASITYGLHSSTGNGYRDDLRQLLAPINVTFVGSQCSGNMSDADNEGHPGFQISQMQAVAAGDIQHNPNVVLTYVGTNDMIATASVAEASSDMAALISFLSMKLPDTLIIICNLFDSSDPRVQQRIDEYNARLYNLKLPPKVVQANISEQLTSTDFFTDGIHPNDSGYLKMAQFFHKFIMTAYTNGDIPDRPVYQGGETHCDKSSAEQSSSSGTPQATGSTTGTTSGVVNSSPTATVSSSNKTVAAIDVWYCLLFLTGWYLL